VHKNRKRDDGTHALADKRCPGDAGNAPLYLLIASSLSNIVLNIIFVGPLKWGIAGIAWATFICQGVCSIISFAILVHRIRGIRHEEPYPLITMEIFKDTARLSIPCIAQQSSIALGNLVVQRLVNSFGVTFMAGYTAGTRLESYLVIPSIGFAVGISTFTGQNIGAKRLDRVKQGYRKTLLMSAVSCALLSALFMLLRKPLVSLFGVSGGSLAMGIEYLLLAAPCFVLFGIYQSATGVLQGAGDVMWTMFFSLSSLALRVLLSYAFAGIFGYRILPYSMAIAWILVAIGATIRYKNGKWLKHTIVSSQ